METTYVLVSGLIVVYLLILTVFLLIVNRHYNRLINTTGKENLTDILNTILDKFSDNKIHLENVSRKIENLERISRYNIRRVGILRFNPFTDTGGDQSFILSLLDESDSGIVLTSLHNRNNTRWYAKNVLNGKGLDFDLTKEELKAIKIARLNKENHHEKS